MARIRKHGVNFSGEGGVESVDSDVVGEETNEVGPVDMEIDERGRGEVAEGLEGTRVGGTDVNAVSEEGLGSESKESSKQVEGSVSSDKDGGKDEGSRECVEGSHSMSVEVKEDVKFEGEDEKKVEVAPVDEEEREGEENAEGIQVEEKSVHVSSSDAEHMVTMSVGEIAQDTPAVEVKIARIDESVQDGELNVSADSQMAGGIENETLEVSVGVKTSEDVLMPENVSPAEDSVKSEDENNSVDLVIDSEPYSGSDGNDSDDMDVSGPSKPEFQAFDLVWGKVRSHPWWPGQICDPSTSSDQAKKYFKKRSYLIAYFWDCTFAWNEAPQIKSFLENFSQMEKQTNMEEFQNAIACALDEVSRRVEFGLACSCISKEAYAKLKTQTIVNAGIKEEATRRDGGDSSLDAASFEPLKLINFAKQAAKLPFGRADKLQLVTARAQLYSFCRWKGISQLPEFNFLGGLLENDADISLLREKEKVNDFPEDAHPVINNDESKRKSKGENSSVYKRKHSEDSSNPRKKGKNFSHVTVEKEKGLSTPMSESGSESKAGSKVVSQSSSKKRKAVGAISDDSAVKQSKNASLAVDDYISLQNKQTFKVGDRICRVATLLNGSSPIFRLSGAAPAADAEEDERKEKSTSQAPQTEKLIDIEDPSPDEMLSHLCLAAIYPNEGYNMMNSLMACFSKFRNTICLEPPSPDEDQLPLGQLFGGKRGKKSTKFLKKSIKPCKSEKSELELVKNSSSDKVVKSEIGELLHGAASDQDTCVVESQSSLDLEAQKLAFDNENRELVHGAATSDTDTCVVESQSSLDLEAEKPACENEIGELVHGAATSDKDTSTVELQASVELNPNSDSEQNISLGDLDSKAANPALDDEKGALARESISVVELSADPKLNPNLDFEQENTGCDTGSEAAKVAPDNESGELVAGALSNKDGSAKELQESLELNPNGDHDSEALKAAPQGLSCEEDSPTALILNFSDSESLPSEEYLNKIFSGFGPLNESQTELLKKTNRAKVVFKRRSDAQKAFSSAGKYSTFGPSLESYRLKYPLSPSKASSTLKAAL